MTSKRDRMQQKMLNTQGLALVVVLLVGILSLIPATRPSTFIMWLGIAGGLVIFVLATLVRVVLARSEPPEQAP